MRGVQKFGLRLWIALAVPGFGLLAAVPGARADNTSRVTLLEENDSLYFNSDKHYTQGLRISDLLPSLDSGSAWNGPFDVFAALPMFSSDPAVTRDRRYAVFFGQSIFTPKDLGAKPPPSNDRPYGGWLYVGTSLLQDSDARMLENLELDLGVVGPMALGEQVQNDFHQLIGAERANGWSDQIQNEPGIDLSYERLWRVPVIGKTSGVDFVPQVGATLGNVFTYGEIGGMMRIGAHLDADYGPVRVRPALSGTDYFNAARLGDNLGYYFFVGAQGRVVGRNIFLDGNSFRTSPSVEHKVLVGDLQTGVSFSWATRIRLDFSVVRRSEEFVGQRAPDVIGTAAVAFAW